ncbi:MAG: hypothetical protein NXI22_05115 [bacterium]|nr:hypothetical protein [bacterium]
MSDQPEPEPKPPSKDEAPEKSDSITSKGISGVFNLESLLLAAAVLLLGVGLMFKEPGLGFWVLLLSGPALFRAFALGAVRRSKGETPSLLTKIMLFCSSAALTGIVGISALIAFVVICFPVGLAGFAMGGQGVSLFAQAIFYGGWVLGFAAGIAILVFSYRMLFWRRW